MIIIIQTTSPWCGAVAEFADPSRLDAGQKERLTGCQATHARRVAMATHQRVLQHPV